MGRAGELDFKGEERGSENRTAARTADPRLCSKAARILTKLPFLCHALTEMLVGLIDTVGVAREPKNELLLCPKFLRQLS